MLILENGEFQRKEKISRWGKAEVRVKPLPRVSSHRGHVSPHPWLHRKKLRIFECCSPVIFRLEVTNRNESCSAAHSKFVLQRGPLDESSCTVNSQDHPHWLPDTIFSDSRHRCCGLPRKWRCGHSWKPSQHLQCVRCAPWVNELLPTSSHSSYLCGLHDYWG